MGKYRNTSRDLHRHTNMERDTGKHVQTHKHSYRSVTQAHTDMERDINIHIQTHRHTEVYA